MPRDRRIRRDDAGKNRGERSPSPFASGVEERLDAFEPRLKEPHCVNGVNYVAVAAPVEKIASPVPASALSTLIERSWPRRR